MARNRTQRRTKKKERTRRQKHKGGAGLRMSLPSNENENEIPSIYTLLGKSDAKKKIILGRLREALQERLDQGKQNWLVFLAKFGSMSEQKRFESPNWVFSDLLSNGHTSEHRILIQFDFKDDDDIKLLFDECPGLFSYITFDGALAGTNITEKNIDSFVKGLTPDGILAAKYDNSSIDQSTDTYETGIFNYPLGVVPLGASFTLGTPLQQFKILIWLMFLAEDANIQLTEDLVADLNFIEERIGYNELVKDCRIKYIAPHRNLNLNAKCKPGLDQIESAFEEINKTNNGAKLWKQIRNGLIDQIQNNWVAPFAIFENGTPVADTIGKNTIVAIRKQ